MAKKKDEAVEQSNVEEVVEQPNVEDVSVKEEVVEPIKVTLEAIVPEVPQVVVPEISVQVTPIATRAYNPHSGNQFWYCL